VELAKSDQANPPRRIDTPKSNSHLWVNRKLEGVVQLGGRGLSLNPNGIGGQQSPNSSLPQMERSGNPHLYKLMKGNTRGDST